ncbi:MAG: Maf family protein [Myxococcota bacterium]|nr:Maf family protein [Myxococcota bacterium]
MRITSAAPLVLGSASPRRRELMTLLEVPFVVRAAGVDEALLGGETPHAYLERVTRAKLDAARSYRSDGESDGRPPRPPGNQSLAMLVADTIVVAPDGEVFGKPANDAESQAMIDRLAATTHEVSTRFMLSEDRVGAPTHAQTVTTRVTFRALSRGESRAYVLAGEGRDKAGGYALQGAAAAFVERIDGSYTGAIGLPLCEVVVAMRGLGWQW